LPVLVDGRKIFDGATAEEAGLLYSMIGQKPGIKVETGRFGNESKK
jgi:hypothetical protein